MLKAEAEGKVWLNSVGTMMSLMLGTLTAMAELEWQRQNKELAEDLYEAEMQRHSSSLVQILTGENPRYAVLPWNTDPNQLATSLVERLGLNLDEDDRPIEYDLSYAIPDAVGLLRVAVFTSLTLYIMKGITADEYVQRLEEAAKERAYDFLGLPEGSIDFVAAEEPKLERSRIRAPRSNDKESTEPAMENSQVSTGIVYILTNPAMDGYIKIGRTDSDLTQRMKSLDTSGVPLPFECYYAASVADSTFVEKRLHEAFADRRVRKNREFFEMPPEQARAALQLAAIAEVKVGEDVYESEDDHAALEKAKKKMANFEFSMIGLEGGETLHFSKNQDVTCTVAGNKSVLFAGEETSISRAALIALQNEGCEWGQVQGTKYWEYRGRTLHDLRLEAQAEG